jgi:hypothetical protein
MVLSSISKIDDFADIFETGEAFLPGALRVSARVDSDIDKAAEMVRALYFSEYKPEAPIELCWSQGRKRFDLIGATFTEVVLLSQRTTDLLLSSNVTGWSTYPVRIFDKDGSVVDGYSGLSVLGRCGPQQPERTQHETRLGRLGAPYPVRKGFYFDEHSWDGSDIFCPAGSTFKLVTRRVKDLLESAKITNINFCALDQLEL